MAKKIVKTKKKALDKPKPIKVKVEKAEMFIDSNTHVQHVPYVPRRIDKVPSPKKQNYGEIISKIRNLDAERMV